MSTLANQRVHILMAVDVPRISDDTYAGTTELDFSGSDSDSAQTKQDDDEETTSVSDYSGGCKGHGEFESTSSEDPDDSIYSDDIGCQFLHEYVAANWSVSKWQSKGKRNIRKLTKRHTEDMDRTHANGRRFTSRRRVPIWRSGDYRDYNFSYRVDSTDNDDDDEDDYGAGDDSQDTENDAYRLDNDFTHSPRTVSKDESAHGDGTASWDLIAWEDDYCDSILCCQPLSSDKERSMLIEVDLKVMARYRRDLQKRQPIISMTSKLNGNSFIGHSIQTEAVEDGFSDNLLAANYDMAIEAMDNYPLPSAWKTARRTANDRLRPLKPSSLTVMGTVWNSQVSTKPHQRRVVLEDLAEKICWC